MAFKTAILLTLSAGAAIALEWLALAQLWAVPLPLLAAIAAAIPAVLAGAAWVLERAKPGIFTSGTAQKTPETSEQTAPSGALPDGAFHDLRSPVRGIEGLAAALEEDFGKNLDGTGRDYLRRIRAECERLRGILDGLQHLDSAIRRPITVAEADISAMTEAIVSGLRAREPERKVDIRIQQGLSVRTDPVLLETILAHLIGNAWKFTRNKDGATIEVKGERNTGMDIFMVVDNGSGFDMAYADKLFKPFQRLHDPAIFPGNGLGLYTAKSITERFGGKIWAEGKENNGAMFCFSIPSDETKR